MIDMPDEIWAYVQNGQLRYRKQRDAPFDRKADETRYIRADHHMALHQANMEIDRLRTIIRDAASARHHPKDCVCAVCEALMLEIEGER